ncbi:hypothetical protein A3K86_18485 [Photobacterium jeanii]|uniref:STAS/SEC14 domain-containing protein n=1 Tax=Photobacterium jeanii TaxID=858640 RepID=A0A178K0Y4_9GAMM|nr:STAS/SEC14 domain-containing protein [Photobacterium jeanii]OAN10970.1 hypothetical protein A3K86_18485 [Photobacterium jeanii]PST90485.1 STAS/SEC14 domain-containing protein [Photobacterium jeanii]
MALSHGLAMDIDQKDDHFFIEIKAIGTLTHGDFEKITPILDDALASVEKPQIDAYIDGSDFEGWELQAAWDDLRLGLKHGKKFHRVAIYGNQRWQEIMAKVGGWFVAGEVRYFDEPLDALAWLRS